MAFLDLLPSRLSSSFHLGMGMKNVMENLVTGWIRHDYREFMSNVMSNLAVGSVAPKSQLPINNFMSNLKIGSVMPKSYDISPEPKHLVVKLN